MFSPIFNIISLQPYVLDNNGAKPFENSIWWQCLNLKQGQGGAAADTTLKVTSGMLARILDAAMKARCTIDVNSPEQVKLADQYGQKWTLQCRLS